MSNLALIASALVITLILLLLDETNKLTPIL